MKLTHFKYTLLHGIDYICPSYLSPNVHAETSTSPHYYLVQHLATSCLLIHFSLKLYCSKEGECTCGISCRNRLCTCYSILPRSQHFVASSVSIFLPFTKSLANFFLDSSSFHILFSSAIAGENKKVLSILMKL